MSHIVSARYRFEPDMLVLDKHMDTYTEEQIKAEPMLWRATTEFAWQNGGPLTKDFLRKVGETQEWVIDSRVHMLMPGMYPCIPGWHHDDVWRDPNSGQPDYNHMPYRSEHVMTVLGPTALPEFLRKPIELSQVQEGQRVYETWNRVINTGLLPEDVRRLHSGEIVRFSWQSFHRGTPATDRGWRWFIRATRASSTHVKPRNERRTQVQVYMDKLDQGW